MSNSYNLRSKGKIQNIEVNESICVTDPILEDILEKSFSDICIKMTLNLDQAIRIIPTYSGDDDLDRFLTACELVHDPLTEDNEKGFLLKLIKTKLTGKAFNAIKYKDIDSFEKLRNELKSQFKQTLSIEQLQTSLCLIQQESSEDVQTFANRVEENLSKLNDACISDQGVANQTIIVALNSRTALKAFVDGLKDPIKIIVKACRYDKLSDAINKAVEEEVSLKGRKSMSRSVSNPSQNNSNVEKQNPNSNTGVKCQICNKVGHTSKICFFRYNQQPEEKSVAQISTRCNYCKNVGHLIKDCRKRKYNEEQKAKAQSQNGTPDEPSNSNPATKDIKNIELKNETELDDKFQNTLRVQDL